MRDENKIPVIVGVGQISDRSDGLDSFQLMHAALQAADADAGGGWLSQIQSLAVVDQISFPELGDVSAPLAEALGASPRQCFKTKYPSGDSPILLLNQAANAIAAAEIDAAAVVGGEALRTAAVRAASRDTARDPVREAAERGARPLRQRYGIIAPTDIYPLYENASRAAFGQSLKEAQQETGEIWSLFSKVAAENANAWLRTPLSAAEIVSVSPKNRPIAFPYTKLMVANASVNQGAGFIVASLAKARRLGVSDDRIIYVGAGAAAREPGDILARDSYQRSASLTTALSKALEFNKLMPGDLDFVELYSCFPCIPKLARRVLNWPLDRPATVFGGLTFGGGPVGNYMSHAVASMVERLRSVGRHGLLFGNGGFATTNHAIVVSRDAALAVDAPRHFDVQGDADRARGEAPALVEDYSGAATLETFTVFYDRSGGARFGVVVARDPSGQRLLARVAPDDSAAIAYLTSGEHDPVGLRGTVHRQADGLNCWRVA
jgi:acetyl-CoA C-acetyltransferase